MPGYGRRTAPRRSRRDWGWHPLQPEWAQRVVDSAGPVASIVVDIGAGTGALTEPLARTGAKVVAVELNDDRAATLRKRFSREEVVVVRSDVADLRWPGRPFHVVASPPYNLTTALVRRILSQRRLQAADLVLQRSAARRLAQDPPGRYAHAYRYELAMGVPRRAFHPPPKVDSVVLRIRPR